MKRLSLLTIFVFGIILAGCTSSPSPVAVSLSPSAAQPLNGGQTVTVTATVTNDSLNKGGTWTLTGAGALCAQSTTAATYTTPATVPPASTATLVATSIGDPTKSNSVTINLTPISVALSPSTA